MGDGFAAMAQWLPERASPDYDEDSVDYFVYDEPAEVQGVVGEVEGQECVRFQVTVTEDGEEVHYTVDLSEVLLASAAKCLEESDMDFRSLDEE